MELPNDKNVIKNTMFVEIYRYWEVQISTVSKGNTKGEFGSGRKTVYIPCVEV